MAEQAGTAKLFHLFTPCFQLQIGYNKRTNRMTAAASGVKVTLHTLLHYSPSFACCIVRHLFSL